MAARCFTWMMYLLIVILRLICNYVRGIGLFPITGYCSNTTSCTENHCELKSNKVCHCYRGKRFSLSLFSKYVSELFLARCHCELSALLCICVSQGTYEKYYQTNVSEIAGCYCSWSALWFGEGTKLCSALSSEMHKEWNQRCLHKVIN